MKHTAKFTDLKWTAQLISAKCTHLFSYSLIPTFATPWTAAHQAPLSMGFSRQEYWSGLPCPPPWDLPDPGIEPRSPTWQADSLPSEPPGMPWILEWVAYPFPRASPQPRNQTRVYCLAGRFFTSWATREASPSTNIRAWNQQLYVKGISCCFYFSWDRGFSLAKAWFLNF